MSLNVDAIVSADRVYCRLLEKFINSLYTDHCYRYMFMSSGEAEDLTRSIMVERGYHAASLSRAFTDAVYSLKKSGWYSDSDFINSFAKTF